MGWETRHAGRQRYYYRKRRAEGRVVSAYAGAGELAEQSAHADDAGRQDTAALRAQQQAMIAVEEALDGRLASLERELRVLTAGALLLAGCHTHKGTWRRARP